MTSSVPQLIARRSKHRQWLVFPIVKVVPYSVRRIIFSFVIFEQTYARSLFYLTLQNVILPRVLAGESVGYVSTFSERTGSDERYASHKTVALYKLSGRTGRDKRYASQKIVTLYMLHGRTGSDERYASDKILYKLSGRTGSDERYPSDKIVTLCCSVCFWLICTVAPHDISWYNSTYIIGCHTPLLRECFPTFRRTLALPCLFVTSGNTRPTTPYDIYMRRYIEARSGHCHNPLCRMLCCCSQLRM